MDNQQEAIEKLAQEFLDVLEVKAKAAVVGGEDGSYNVSVEGEDLGILIGFHGEALNALQLLLSLMVYRKFGAWFHILVDVGNYRSERNQKLSEIAERAAQKARFLQKEIDLRPMSSYDRRIIHSVVSKMEGVKSSSEGEGKDRHVVVSPT